jgi:hypothetical protein
VLTGNPMSFTDTATGAFAAYTSTLEVPPSGSLRNRRYVLIRADCSGGTREFFTWLAKPGRRLAYSVGFTIIDDVQDAIGTIPAAAWIPVYDSEGQVRPDVGGRDHRHAGPVVLASRNADHCPQATPRPGAQLRFTDPDGHRFTYFATDTKRGQLADLELRHHRLARSEGRIRCAKDTGLTARTIPATGEETTRARGTPPARRDSRPPP